MHQEKNLPSPGLACLRTAAALAVVFCLAFATAVAERVEKNDNLLKFPRFQRQLTDRPQVPDFPRIIGGEIAPEGAFPWIAAVTETAAFQAVGGFNAQFCAGILITPRWVVTAAHCAFSDLGFTVPYEPGELTLLLNRTNLDDTESGEEVLVDKVIPHPDFDPARFATDIALLRLETPSIQPTLPLLESSDSPLTQPGTMAMVLGWGADEVVGGNPSSFPVDLLQATLPIVSDQSCVAAYANENPPIDISGTQICAGVIPEGGIDTCNGDSGGPLAVPDGEGGFLLAGITSFGPEDCGSGALPGVYTQISSFADWIFDNIFNTRYFAQYGNGSTLSSDVVVVNPSATQSATGEIQIWDFEGNQVNTVPFNLSPEGSITLPGSGDGALTVGSVTIISEPQVSGIVRFNLPGTGIAGIANGLPGKALIAPARNQDGVRTGVAIRNASRQPVTFDIILRGADGQELARLPDTQLQPNERVASFIDEIFMDLPELQGTFQGTISIRVTGEGRVAVVALEQGSRPGEFTTLPVTPIEQ